MAKLAPVSWRELVQRLHELGFGGLYAGGRHPQMRRGQLTLIISCRELAGCQPGFSRVSMTDTGLNRWARLAAMIDRLSAGEHNPVKTLRASVTDRI